MGTFQFLTVTVRAGSRLPKSSKMVITAEISKIAQTLLKRLYLKFENESFGAIKFSEKNSAEISPEMNRKMTGNDIFKTTNRIFRAPEIHNS